MRAYEEFLTILDIVAMQCNPYAIGSNRIVGTSWAATCIVVVEVCEVLRHVP